MDSLDEARRADRVLESEEVSFTRRLVDEEKPVETLVRDNTVDRALKVLNTKLRREGLLPDPARRAVNIRRSVSGRPPSGATE